MIVMEALSRQSRVTGISSRPFSQSVKQNLLCNQRCTINLLIPVNFRKNSLARKYSRVYI